MTVQLISWEGGLLLPLAECRVVQCRVDYAFTLIIQGPLGYYDLRIQQPFAFADRESSEGIVVGVGGDPSGAAPGLPLLHRDLIEAEASRRGELTVRLHNGGWLRVGMDEDYEAWTMAGPQGLHLVCAPGGELTVWSPTAESGENSAN